jgi:two-component system, NtrC family, sensor kinase
MSSTAQPVAGDPSRAAALAGTPACGAPPSDPRLQKLADLTTDAVAIVDQGSYRLEYLNPAGRALLGLRNDEALTEHVLLEFVPNHCLWTVLNDAVPAALRNGSWRGELELRSLDGGERPVSLAVLAQPAAPGAPAEALFFVARDFAANRELIDSLKRERQVLRSLLQNAPDCIYYKDMESRFLRVSHAMAIKFGVGDPQKMIGKTDFDFFAREHAQPRLEMEREILRKEKPLIDLVEKETWPDGRVTWVSTTKLPFYNEYGQLAGTLGISRDITSRKNAELVLAETRRRLLDASRMAGMAEVASGVLHNIGNAFNSVNTSASVIAERLAQSRIKNVSKVVRLIEENSADLGSFFTSDPRGRQLPAYLSQLANFLNEEHAALTREIETLRRSGEHIKTVINMQQGYALASNLAEDLSGVELIEEALQISEASLNRHGITLHRDFHPVPPVRAARHKVLQILVNLIRNAKHSMDEAAPPEKLLGLAIRATGNGRIQFVVSDNGVGIPAENLRKIFSFGFTTKKDGHGFGLHSSALAAEEMGGSLTPASEGRGRGASFILELPAASDGSKAPVS